MKYVWLVEIEGAATKYCIISNNYENAIKLAKEHRRSAELFVPVKSVVQIATVDAMDPA